MIAYSGGDHGGLLRLAGGAGLPPFVEQEFRGFLTCGVLTHGFARLRCDTCAFERLVSFSWCSKLGIKLMSLLRLVLAVILIAEQFVPTRDILTGGIPPILSSSRANSY